MTENQQLKQEIIALQAKVESLQAQVIALQAGQAEQQQWLTVKQAASVANVNERTIRRWIERGKLRATNAGGAKQASRWRINPQALQEALGGR